MAHQTTDHSIDWKLLEAALPSDRGSFDVEDQFECYGFMWLQFECCVCGRTGTFEDADCPDLRWIISAARRARRDGWRLARLPVHICWLAVCLAFTGCMTRAGARHLSGTYVHRETGGLIVFRPNGEFYYSFTTPTKTLPRHLGYYHFESSTDAEPSLQVRSAHYGLFSIRVSESGDRVFLTHPKLFASEQVYERQ